MIGKRGPSLFCATSQLLHSTTAELTPSVHPSFSSACQLATKCNEWYAEAAGEQLKAHFPWGTAFATRRNCIIFQVIVVRDEIGK
jgi:hypothetical protein